jgi:hypothetical protein
VGMDHPSGFLLFVKHQKSVTITSDPQRMSDGQTGKAGPNDECINVVHNSVALMSDFKYLQR